MSTSDEEATSLFRRADKSRLASGREAGGSALRSPSKRLLPPPPDDSSSDIEFVGTSSAIKRRAAQDGKGKGKAAPDQAPSRKLATTSTTNKGPPSTRKTGRSSRRLSSVSSLDSSSDDDPRMPTSGQILPSATQIADSGATLRALAREKGWQGQSPPPCSRSRTEPNKPAAKKRKQKVASDDSEDLSDFGQRRGRNVSASTEQTTISDQSSSSHTKARKTVAAATAPAAGAKRASKKVADSTARAKPRQKRASKAAAASSSPSPELELDLDNLPPPPESFWGVDTSLTKAGAATKKHKHGEATKRLQTLSEQRAMLVLPDDDEDEIAIADTGSSSAGENEKYELTAVKSKREKEEALARLRAKRGKQSVEPVARVSPPPADSRDPPRQGSGKGKQKAVGPATAACPLCTIEFAVDELEAHTNECLDGFGMDEDFEPTAAPAPVAGPSKSAFRPAGAAAAAAAPPRPPPAATVGRGGGARTDNLAAALFPSSPAPQKRTTGAATSKKRYSPADDDAEDEVFAISPAKKSKGKGPARRPDGYLTSDGYDDALPALDASLNGTIIDLRADEDDEMTNARRGRGGGIFAAGANRCGDGRDGAINSNFAPGPPAEGSSPPRGSMFISTMSAAYIDGYARLYAKPVPKGKKARTSTNGANFDPDVDDSEAREFDALAPPAPRRASGSGRGGGGGRGGKRGGNRRGSWSWRARARGRGGGKRT